MGSEKGSEEGSEEGSEAGEERCGECNVDRTLLLSMFFFKSNN